MMESVAMCELFSIFNMPGGRGKFVVADNSTLFLVRAMLLFFQIISGSSQKL